MSEKTVAVSITVPENLLDKIDKQRGDVSRSKFISKKLGGVIS